MLSIATHHAPRVPVELAYPSPPARATRGLKILHVMPTFSLEWGGPVRAVIDLSDAMAGLGHEVDVLTCTDAACPQTWRGNARAGAFPRLITHRPGSLPGPLFTPPQLAPFGPLLERYDVVHFHNIWRPSILQLAPLAEKAGAAYIVSARGMLDDWSMAQKRTKKLAFLALGARRVLERAGWVHCTADAEQAQTRRWIGRGRSAVVPNYMDLRPYVDPAPAAEARRRFDIPDDGVPLVLFLSRIDRKKGVETLIRSSALLHRRGVPHRLIVAGNADPHYLSAMKQLTHDLEMDEVVRFVGMVTGDLKRSLLSAATVFALPSSQENFGFVYFEALACGTPVVTTHCVDTAADLEAGGGALLAELDPEPFSARLEPLLYDPDLARQMGAAGRRWAFKFLSPRPLLARFESLYRTAHERWPRMPDPAPYLPV